MGCTSSKYFWPTADWGLVQLLPRDGCTEYGVCNVGWCWWGSGCVVGTIVPTARARKASRVSDRHCEIAWRQGPSTRAVGATPISNMPCNMHTDLRASRGFPDWATGANEAGGSVKPRRRVVGASPRGSWVRIRRGRLMMLLQVRRTYVHDHRP